ncbi:MAG: oligosaccharide flippase family protein [Candidatus Aminicenantales bacterium]
MTDSPERDESSKITKNGIQALIRKNSPYVVLERAVGATVSFLTTVFILRSLSVEAFGIYSVLLSVMLYVGLFSSLGLPSLFQRFIPEFFQKNEIGKLKNLIGKGLFWRFLAGAGLIIVLLMFSAPLGRLFRITKALEYLGLFALAIIFYLETQLQGTILTSVFRHKWYAIAQISYIVLRAAILFVLISLGFGLNGLLAGEAIAYFFLFVVQHFYYRKFLAAHPSDSARMELPFKRLMKFGGFTFFNETGAQILSDSTDVFVIAAFLGPAAVGTYAFATRVMALATRVLPQSVFMNVIRPAFFTMYVSDEDQDQINSRFNFLVKLIAFFSVPLVSAIFVLGDKMIIHIFDPKYLSSLKVLWVVAAFTGFNFFFEPIGLVLQSIEKVEVLFTSKIFAVYNLATSLLWIKPYGIMGVAVSTGSAILFKNLFCYFLAKRHVRLNLDLKGIGIIAVNSLIMAGALMLMRPWAQSLVTFLLICLIGLGVYLALGSLNKAFSKSERDFINKILPKPVFNF